VALAGCGKTHSDHRIQQFCNKGTASDEPQMIEKRLGLSAPAGIPFAPSQPHRLSPQPVELAIAPSPANLKVA
jgi:hypothetical protein